ncbi:hypothetical protein [Nocardioides jishulii]|uniref:Uncharacterized protein n=1 Tax=Nocardioides jishulii TaxID=2575440 RepID=A0A4U2YJ96_9ACTN|nr:hypothetical protein [Nocardioides jishulii]QCX28090.1 hypothetical protein FCL41_11600 [Nocardioides jishulii]TKI60754.1 hypothetical protein FC770_14675 [Nocardioides jishulii]
MSAVPVAVPCPSWCDEESGHGYELVGPQDSDARIHGTIAAREGDWVADVTGFGYWTGKGETLERLGIELNQPEVVDSRELAVSSAEEARALARLLLAAADTMDRINAEVPA